MAKTREEYRKEKEELFAPVKKVGSAVKKEWNRSVENSKATRRIRPTSALNKGPFAGREPSNPPSTADLFAPAPTGRNLSEPTSNPDSFAFPQGEPFRASPVDPYEERRISGTGNDLKLTGSPFTNQQGILKEGVHLGGQHFKSLDTLGQTRAADLLRGPGAPGAPGAPGGPGVAPGGPGHQPGAGPEIRRDGFAMGSYGDALNQIRLQLAQLNRGRPTMERDGVSAVADFDHAIRDERKLLFQQAENLFLAQGADRDKARELAVQELRNEGYAETNWMNNEASLQRQELTGEQQLAQEKYRQQGLSDRQAVTLAAEENEARAEAILDTYNSLLKDTDLLAGMDGESALSEEEKDKLFEEARARVDKVYSLAGKARGRLNEDEMPPPITEEERQQMAGSNQQSLSEGGFWNFNKIGGIPRGNPFKILTDPTADQAQLLQAANPYYGFSQNLTNMFKK